MKTWICAALLLGNWSVLRAQQELVPTNTTQMEEALEAYRRTLLDWGGLTQYGSQDAELRVRHVQPEVVFLGDEITEDWGKGKAKFFPGKPYLNRGITRQVAAQMLVRFRQDVINLKPKVVVIEAGTNDLGRVMGPSSEDTMGQSIKSMVELAKLHDIRVVLASVTPICNCSDPEATARRPPGKIIGLNGWLKDYAKESGSIYLDYYSALVQGRTMRPDLTVDGLVPNDAGYERMAPLAEKAIAEALGHP